jgi:hypothetical protein
VKKWIVILSVLLTAQLCLAVVVDMSGDSYAAFKPTEKLLAFKPETVDGVRIESDKKSIELSKRDGKWILPESDGFPANQTAVSGLLDKLAALEKGWPVATSSSAATHFKVADGDFERKLILQSQGKDVATLYVGTSPGFRKVNVRPKGQDAVYAVAFNAWEANAKSDDWINKEILKLDEKTVKQVEMPGIVLQREGDALKLTGLNDKQQTNEKEAKALVDKLAALRIESLLGTEAKPDYQQDKPSLEIKLTQDDGKQLTYRFSKPKVGGYYILKRSDLAPYFKVAEFEVSPIKDEARDKLVQVKADEKPGKSNAEPATTSVTTANSGAGG